MRIFVCTIVLATVTSVIGDKLVFPEYGYELLLFEPKSGFVCNDVVPGSEELSWFTKFKSPFYSVYDMVCRFHLIAECKWSFEFPNNDRIESSDLKLKPYMKPGTPDKRPEEFFFKPKSGFSCADWPGSEELNWLSKLMSRAHKVSDTVCRVFVHPICEESFYWPKGSLPEKTASRTFRSKKKFFR